MARRYVVTVTVAVEVSAANDADARRKARNLVVGTLDAGGAGLPVGSSYAVRVGNPQDDRHKIGLSSFCSTWGIRPRKA